MVKRVRGVAYSTRVSPHISNRMFAAARGVLKRLLPDVHIFTDHYSGAESGRSPGYGISLVAETTTGCLLGVDGAANCSKENEFEENRMQMLPEDLGSQAAMLLLEEIKEGGVVDTTHQSLLFLLCALCPEDVCQVRIGKLSPYGIQTLHNIKEFLDVKFNIQPHSKTGTVILTCVGSGYRKVT